MWAGVSSLLSSQHHPPGDGGDGGSQGARVDSLRVGFEVVLF